MRLIRIFYGVLFSIPVLMTVSVMGLPFIVWAEHQYSSVPFVVVTTAAIAAAIFVITRKLAFSVYAAFTLLAVLTLASYVKYLLDGTTVQFSDLVLVAGDSALPVFLLTNYTSYALPLIAFMAAAGIFLVMAARIERPRKLGWLGRILPLVVASALVPLSFPAAGANSLYFMSLHFASSFFVSLRDVGNLWDEPAIVHRLRAMPALAPYNPAFQCGPATKRPDVVFIQAESAMPPSLMPSWGVENSAIGDFSSDDGHLHKLGVEGFGGASWVSTANVLTGISGSDFDWLRTRITYALAGKVAISVPAILRACGYNTAAVLPTQYGFVNIGPFLTSIGIETVIDRAAMGITSPDTRDMRYFSRALDLIRANRAASGRPSFVYVETALTHSPYDQRRDAGTKVPGEPFAPDPQINEYLRRLALFYRDLASFRQALEDEATTAGVLLLQYGDHQPSVARLDVDDQIGVGASLGDWRSAAYTTYYSVRSLGAAPLLILPDQDRLDLAFLGYAVIKAAGLATGGVIDESERLRVLCDGYFHMCSDRDSIDRHLRKLIDSGLLDIGGMK